MRRGWSIRAIGSALGLVLLPWGVARGQGPVVTALLSDLPGTSRVWSTYGESVAIDATGDTLFVGDPDDLVAVPTDDPGDGVLAGSVRIFGRTADGWVELQTLNGPRRDALFGLDLAGSADGSRVVVGTPGSLGNGSAAVYARSGSTWSREAVLRVGPEPANGSFGWSVAMDAGGTRFVAGAPGRDGIGAAYVLTRSGETWTLEAELAPPVPTAHAGFGYAVAMSDDGRRVIVSASGIRTSDDGRSGAAFVFVRSATDWTLEAEVSTPTRHELGESVALSADGSRAVVCADWAGAAIHAFVRTDSGWTAEGLVVAGVPESPWCQGLAISAAGDRVFLRAVAGSPEVSTIRIFSRRSSGWIEEAPLAPPAGELYLGGAIAPSADGTLLLVGAHTGTDTAPGHAYVYRIGVAGAECDASTPCELGYCVDGVCCVEPCDGACEACATAFGGAEDGRCTGLRADAELEVCRAVANACDAAEVCASETRGCPADASRPDGTPCGETDPCAGPDLCVLGSCTATPPPTCDDGDLCTDDRCVADVGCTHERWCMGPTDAGAPDAAPPFDAAVTTDAAAEPDAGPRPTHAVYGCGCGCMVSRARTATPAAALFLVLALLRARRRRRRSTDET